MYVVMFEFDGGYDVVFATNEIIAIIDTHIDDVLD